MTINSTAAASGPYTGTGLQQILPFDFHAASVDEVRVEVNGAPVYGFSVTLESDGTGSVVGTFLLGGTIYIESAPSFLQETDFDRFAPYFPDSLNPPLDRAAIRDIALRDMVSRAPVVPRSFVDVAGKFPTIGADGNWQLVDGVPGIAGPAAAFRATLATLKAANTGDGVSQYDGANWYWTLGNFGATSADDLDVNIVKANSTSLTVGAWVRHSSSKMLFNAAGSPYFYTAENKLRQIVSVEDFGAHGTGPNRDDTGAFADILATGRNVYVPYPPTAYAVENVPLSSRSHVRGETDGLAAGPKIAVGSSGSAAFRAAPDYTSEVRLENLMALAAPGVTNARFIDKTDLTTYLAYGKFYNIETHRNLRYSYRANFIFGQWVGCRDGYLTLGLDYLVGTDSIHCAIQSTPAAYGQGNEPNINKVVDSHFFGAFGGEAALDFRYGHRLGIYGCDFENLNCAGLAAFGVGGIEISGGWSEAVNADAVFRIMGFPNAANSGSQLHLHDYTMRMIGSAQYAVAIEPSSVSRLDVEDVSLFFVDSAKRLTNAPALVGVNRNVRAFIGVNEIPSQTAPNFHLNAHREAVLLGGRTLAHGAADNNITAMAYQNAGGVAAQGGFMSRNDVAVGSSPVVVATSATGLGGTVVISGYVNGSGAQFRFVKNWQGNTVNDAAAPIDSTGGAITFAFAVSGFDLTMTISGAGGVVFTTMLN